MSPPIAPPAKLPSTPQMFSETAVSYTHLDVYKRQRRHRSSDVRFIDTICHPTKQRQTAMDDLLRDCDHIFVIGGRNSNNTRQLVQKATAHGLPAIQIEGPGELDPAWFGKARNVGVTAGTSTLDETVDAVMQRLRQIAAELRSNPVHEFLRSMLHAA